jgi:hypothetical protein
MQHAHALSLRGLQPVALEALVQPDGLQEFFGRHGAAIAEEVHGAALFAPHGIKVLGLEVDAREIHGLLFAPLGGNVKPAKKPRSGFFCILCNSKKPEEGENYGASIAQRVSRSKKFPVFVVGLPAVRECDGVFRL